MAIVCQTSFGYFLDELQDPCLTIDKSLFNIDTPFMMEKQFFGWLNEQSSSPQKPRNRKKKKQLPLIRTKLLCFIENGRRSIIGALEKQTFSILCRNVTPTNNSEARTLARPYIHLSSLFAALAGTWSEKKHLEIRVLDEVTFPYHFTKTIIFNPASSEQEVVLSADLVLKVPPLSSFLISDMQSLANLMLESSAGRAFVSDGFDFIVIDPPWPNKSVKRKKMYDYVDFDDLKTALCPLLRYCCRPNAIVAMWATPLNSRVRDFVINEVFPCNALKHISTMHWLKITKTGEPICPLFSSGSDCRKVPFEELYLGRFMPDSKSFSTDTNVEEQLIVSVPAALHSKKPYILDILKRYSDKDTPRCCELFARQLRPHWFSWGREPVLLNLKHTQI